MLYSRNREQLTELSILSHSFLQPVHPKTYFVKQALAEIGGFIYFWPDLIQPRSFPVLCGVRFPYVWRWKACAHSVESSRSLTSTERGVIHWKLATYRGLIKLVTSIKMHTCITHWAKHSARSVVLLLLLLFIPAINMQSCCMLLWQVLPYFVMEVLRFPGFPGLFAACVFSGALRFEKLCPEHE